MLGLQVLGGGQNVSFGGFRAFGSWVLRFRGLGQGIQTLGLEPWVYGLQFKSSRNLNH